MIGKREPWPFLDQLAAVGIEAPKVHRDGWVFARGRLYVHLCAKGKKCEPCAEAQKAGWRTEKVSADEVLDGRALDRIAGLLWRAPAVQARLL